MFLTVVLPCLNEEKTIALCIEKAKKSFDTLGINGKIIVVDNGSTDNSVSIAKNFGAEVIYCSEKGYGNALKFGFNYAVNSAEASNNRDISNDFVLMADADNTYDLLEIPLYCNAVDDNVDLVMGTRLKGNIHKGAMPFLHRYLGTPVLTIILNLLYGTKISDSQCGMRLMRLSALKQIDFKTTGMEFASEILVQFAKRKFKIKEVPISLHNAYKGRVAHLSPWRDGIRHLKYLFGSRFIGF